MFLLFLLLLLLQFSSFLYLADFVKHIKNKINNNKKKKKHAHKITHAQQRNNNTKILTHPHKTPKRTRTRNNDATTRNYILVGCSSVLVVLVGWLLVYFLKKSFFSEALTPPGPERELVLRCLSGGGNDLVLAKSDGDMLLVLATLLQALMAACVRLIHMFISWSSLQRKRYWPPLANLRRKTCSFFV